MTPDLNLITISPAIAITLTGFLLILATLIVPKMSRVFGLTLAIAGLTVAAWLTFRLWNVNSIAFGGLVVADNFALTFTFIFLIGAGLSLLASFNEHEAGYLLYPEFFAVTMFATLGMLLMAASTHLLIIFLGLETLSISLYVLVAIKRREPASLEAAFKYFLLGAFASAFLLYGIALLYGVSGSFDLQEIATVVHDPLKRGNPLVILGGIFLMIGLGFKVAMFPFHMWAPDVYQGAPTPVAAFMSTCSKAAGFAAMLRVLFSVSNGAASDWVTVLWVVAVLSMFIGNLSAIAQKNVKRMLAFSSIAHAGYILIGVVSWSAMGSASVIFYLLSYTFMNVGAFSVISYLSTDEREFVDLKDFRGLAYRKPMIAFVMAVFMFSLAGLPPTAGFVGKFYLFAAAVKAGHIPLVVIGVINSMIALYYYLGVVVAMFMREPETAETAPRNLPVALASLLIAVAATFALGLFPSYWIDSFELLFTSIL